MTLHDFYVAIGGDYAAAVSAMGDEQQVVSCLRAFPYAQDYAGLLTAMRDSRWQDAADCAAAISREAEALFCSGLQRAGDALAEALVRSEGDVLTLRENLAREYRNVIAAINGVTN